MGGNSWSCETSAPGPRTHLLFKGGVIMLSESGRHSGPCPLEDHSSLRIWCPPHLASPRPPASAPTTAFPPATLGHGQGLSCAATRYHGPPCHQKHLPPSHLSKSIPLHRSLVELLGWAAATRGHRCPAHVPGTSSLLERTSSTPLACRKAGGDNACLTKSWNMDKTDTPGPYPMSSGPSGPNLHTSRDGTLTISSQAVTALPYVRSVSQGP